MIDKRLTIIIYIISILIIYPCSLFSFQEDNRPYKKLLHYNVKQWGTDKGLPTNNLLTIDKTKDGFIWVSSFSGLFRFDGIEFLEFNKINTEGLESNHIRIVKSDGNGRLWLGTGSGLVKYENQKFTTFSFGNKEVNINTIFIDNQEGKVWVGTREKGVYIFDIKTNNYKKIEIPKFKHKIIRSFIKDKKGGIWIACEGRGLTYYYNNKWLFYGKAEGLTNIEAIDLYFDSNGRLFVGTSEGLFIYNGKTFSIVLGMERGIILKIVEDQYNNLWVLTNTGIYRRIKNTDNWENLSKANGLPSNDVADIIFDDDDNVWLTTNSKGLIQLVDSDFITYSVNDGMAIDQVSIIHDWAENKTVVGTAKGDLYVIENNDVNPLYVKNKILTRVYGFISDQEEILWVVSYDGLLRKIPGKPDKKYTMKDGLPTLRLRVIFQDSKNNIWIGSRTDGLIKMTVNRITKEPSFEIINIDNSDLNSNFIMSIEEGSKGELIFGTNTGGLNIRSENGDFNHYTIENGLSSNMIFNTHLDNQGVLWIATNEGLNRMEGNMFFNYSSLDGLPNDSPFDILEDEFGYLWMPSSVGIIKVKKQELDDYKNGKINSIQWKLYNKEEGMRNSECFGGTSSFKAKDGTLWIPSFNGAIKIDPNKISQNSITPKVYVTSIYIDDKEINLKNRLVVSPEKHRYQFSYSAISLLYPEKVKFKYKIKNYDNQWIEAGKKRQAYYTGIPHGDYSFKVIASNNDGIWSENIAEVKFTVLPFFYQTWWFYLLIIVIFGLISYVYSQWRNYSIKNKSENLEKEVRIRTKLLRRKSDENEILNKVSSNLIAPIELESLLNNIIESAVKITPAAEKGSILLLNPEGDELEAKAVYGYPKNYIGKIRIKVGEGQSGKAIIEGRSFIKNDMNEEIPPFPAELKEWQPIKSIMVVLLEVKNKIIGTISLDNVTRHNAFGVHDMNILVSLAANASVAIERVKINKELESNKNELLKSNKELNIAYKELKEMNDFKEAMTGMIIHDFKNSLNTVISFSDGTPTERRLKSIRQAGKNMLNMVMNILDVQKFEKASINLSKRIDPIKKVINDAIKQVSFLIEQKSLKLTFDIDEELMTQVDFELITRVVINMLTNAIKYSPHNGIINFKTENKGSEIKIYISDNGQGIPSDKLESIFDKFSQLDAKNTGNIRSTGLGLTFCKMVVEAHGGMIGVESEVNKGSTFWFTIPKFEGHNIMNEENNDLNLEIPVENNYILSHKDKEVLKPLIKQLQKWDVYSYTEVLEIIEALKHQNNPALKSWYIEMKKVLLNLNEEKYNELIDI